MANLNKEMIKYLMQLCRISLNESEQDALLVDLGKILAYAEQLQEIDTQNVPPCHHVLANMVNVTREDIPGKIMPRDVFLGNAPAQVAGLIRVPPVFKQQ